MTSPRSLSHSRIFRGIFLVLGCALTGFFGGWVASEINRAQSEDMREYLLANPEIILETIDQLQQNETAERIAPLQPALEAPYPGAVLGNPAGSVTLVEFSDYACGYCRRSLADVQSLIATNPELRVVVREYPILSDQSIVAARWALAAADQGKFAAFHDAMFAAGAPTDAAIEAAARNAGLDLAAARTAIADGRYDSEIANNQSLAQQLGFNGTPSWVIGTQALAGAVGVQELSEAIAIASAS